MPKAKQKAKAKPKPQKEQRDFSQIAFDVVQKATEIKPQRRRYEIRRKR